MKNWLVFRKNLDGTECFPNVIDNINRIYEEIKYSARRDSLIWEKSDFSLYKDVKTMNDGFISKLDWMEDFINSLQ
jgi:hypothetical protein